MGILQCPPLAVLLSESAWSSLSDSHCPQSPSEWRPESRAVESSQFLTASNCRPTAWQPPRLGGLQSARLARAPSAGSRCHASGLEGRREDCRQLNIAGELSRSTPRALRPKNIPTTAMPTTAKVQVISATAPTSALARPARTRAPTMAVPLLPVLRAPNCAVTASVAFGHAPFHLPNDTNGQGRRSSDTTTAPAHVY